MCRRACACTMREGLPGLEPLQVRHGERMDRTEQSCRERRAGAHASCLGPCVRLQAAEAAGRTASDDEADPYGEGVDSDSEGSSGEGGKGLSFWR
jgi:hypothetical protein